MKISPWLQLGTSTFLSLGNEQGMFLVKLLLEQINKITYN